MVLLRRMLVAGLACMIMSLARPTVTFAQTENDTAALAQEVLEAFEYEAQAASERELVVREQAERGDARAQHELGALLAVGKGGEQDYAEAARWFRRAAGQGHAAAQYWLGNLYMRGVGVPQDTKRMLQWWSKAAEQGNISAQYALGMAYSDGRLVQRDFKRAKAWFVMANSMNLKEDGGDQPKATQRKLTRSEIEAAEMEARRAEMRARRMESFKKEDPQAGR